MTVMLNGCLAISAKVYRLEVLLTKAQNTYPAHLEKKRNEKKKCPKAQLTNPKGEAQ